MKCQKQNNLHLTNVYSIAQENGSNVSVRGLIGQWGVDSSLRALIVSSCDQACLQAAAPPTSTLLHNSLVMSSCGTPSDFQWNAFKLRSEEIGLRLTVYPECTSDQTSEYHHWFLLVTQLDTDVVFWLRLIRASVLMWLCWWKVRWLWWRRGHHWLGLRTRLLWPTVALTVGQLVSERFQTCCQAERQRSVSENITVKEEVEQEVTGRGGCVIK